VAVKRAILIKVAGRQYTIKSDASDGYVQELADLVDQRIQAVQASAKSASPQAVAVLTALQFADELLHERQRRTRLRQRVREKTHHLKALLDREASA
jgi:cell division protein ZapA (FtsZ GTPase activity inhibitor)